MPKTMKRPSPHGIVVTGAPVLNADASGRPSEPHGPQAAAGGGLASAGNANNAAAATASQ